MAPAASSPSNGDLDDLDRIEERIISEFTGPMAADRLGILHAHVATVKMVITQLYEEAARSEGYK